MIDKLFTSVSGFYKDINPSTLSGATDIIVVKDENGKLKSTPFHARFGKLQMFRITSRIVHLVVNGTMTDVYMKIGNYGELYFEIENEEEHIFKEEFRLLFQKEDIKKVKKRPSSDGEHNPVSYEIEELTSSLNSLKIQEIVTVSPQINVDDNILKKKERLVYKNEHLRNQNYQKRFFFKKLLKDEILISEENIYLNLTKKYKHFHKFINSLDYFEFLVKKHRLLFHLMSGLVLPNSTPKLKRVCDINYKHTMGCSSTTLRYSLCFNQKIKHGIENAFESCLVKGLEKTHNLIVEIKGCEKCNQAFYLPFTLFSEMFFFVRNLIFKETKYKYDRFLKYIESECEKKKGWSLFKKSLSIFRKTTKKRIKKNISLTPSSEQLETLNLKDGKNEIIFKVEGLDQRLVANLYLWNKDSKILISDIDGTITKSDVWGHLYTIVGKDWTHIGVAQLFTRIVKNGYKILYLTSRPIGQSSITKDYIRNVKQNKFTLPDGPVILSPDGLLSALYREIIIRKPEDFKIACLKNIKELFGEINPFISGFGNKITDVITYKAVKIPLSKIFTINHRGQIHLELARTLSSSYLTLNGFVDGLFPPVSLNSPVVKNYGDLEFWGYTNT